jgi:hypothetical protein
MGSPFVITGAAQLVSAPKASIAPQRWSGTPAKLARMDRLCALALVACDGALLDAGTTAEGERTAVVLGTAFGCHATNEDYYRGVVAGGAAAASPRLFAYTLPSSPVGEVSIHFAIRGPAVAVAPGLTAGLDAIAAAQRELSAGRADRALIVAADVATPLGERLHGTPILDGAAALFVEPAGDRRARGRVLACASAFAAGSPADALCEAARRLLADAGVGAGAIARVCGRPADVAALRAIDLAAPADSTLADGDTLGAAPLRAVARFLAGGAGSALFVASDPEGAASVALVAAA